MNMRHFKIGDKVTWKYVPRGGYGWVFRTPGEVVSFGKTRVKIRVSKVDGSVVERFVNENSLEATKEATK